MIFQEPMTSLNPVMKIGKQLEEPLLLHTNLSKEERRQIVYQKLEQAGLKDAEKMIARISPFSMVKLLSSTTLFSLSFSGNEIERCFTSNIGKCVSCLCIFCQMLCQRCYLRLR